MVFTPGPFFLIFPIVYLALLFAMLFGSFVGIAGVVAGLLARWNSSREAIELGRVARSCGKAALVFGGVILSVSTLFCLGLGGDLRTLLFAEPPLMLGLAAVTIGRRCPRPGFRIGGLIAFIAWIGVAIGTPIQLSTLQRDREARQGVELALERLESADKYMEERYEKTVNSKIWSVHGQQARDWARLGLDDARHGYRCSQRLAARARDESERMRQLERQAYFAAQVERYEAFVRGLGMKP